MNKATERNKKFGQSFIISIVLHVVLLVVIILGALKQHLNISGNEGGEIVNAVIIDPKAIAQQSNRTQQQQQDIIRSQKTLEDLKKQQEQDLQNRQTQEIEKLKNIKQELLTSQQEASKLEQQKQLAQQALDKAQQEKTAVEAATQLAKKQAAELAKKQAAELAKKQAAELAKKQAAELAKKQAAELAKKQAAELAKKQAAELAKKQAQEVQDLISGLASTSKDKVVSANGASGGGNNAGIAGSNASDYSQLIGKAIANKLYNCPLYLGRTCDLEIQLSPEGKIITAQALRGDSSFCNAAVTAAQQALIPKPTKIEYEKYKEATLLYTLKSCD